jgi:hypothetical protein
MPGFRLIEVPADADGPALKGAMWYPCSQPPGEIALDGYTLTVAKDCPISGDGGAARRRFAWQWRLRTQPLRHRRDTR